MPIKTRVIEIASMDTTFDHIRSSRYINKETGERPVPGDVFYAPWYLGNWQDQLSTYYFQHNSHRAPIIVVLPNSDWFCVDSAFWSQADSNEARRGWIVRGPIEALVVEPSINCVGRWHGYLGSCNVSPGYLSEAV